MKTKTTHAIGKVSQGRMEGRRGVPHQDQVPVQRTLAWKIESRESHQRTEVDMCLDPEDRDIQRRPRHEGDVRQRPVRHGHFALSRREAGIATGRPEWLTCEGEDPRCSSCRYVVPVLNWKGRRELIRARVVSYTTPSEAREAPDGARAAFPEVVWEDLEEGPLDMIIGKDKPEWMPFPGERNRKNSSH
jgi:hypothetical protein